PAPALKQQTGRTDESGAMKSPIASLCIVFGLALRAAVAPAQDAHADALRRQLDHWDEQQAQEEALRQQWQERERERIKAVEDARAHLAEVQASRVHARDGAYQGVKRSEWTRRAEEAQKDLGEAERELTSLHEEARKADVPPGWFQSDK